MKLTYSEAVALLTEKRRAGIVYSLERMEELMRDLNHPEKEIRSLHIAGTNGKGSVCAFISSILSEAGFTVGAFNTPVFGEEKDQLTINRVPISKEDFARAFSDILPSVEKVERERREDISEFECLTALAFYFFARLMPMDVVLIEAGMGGRLDATNVLPSPIATVITNVSYDHQAFLGNTIEKIAMEKAGIIKSSSPHFTAAEGRALQIMKKVANKKKTDIFSLQDNTYIKRLANDTFEFKMGDTSSAQSYTLTLKGQHQIMNAALTLLTITVLVDQLQWKVTEKDLKRGLLRAGLEGRWETISDVPEIIIDTAHNDDAMAAVCNTISALPDNKQVTVLFGAMKDKAVGNMLKRLQALNLKVYVTEFPNPRCMTKEEYRQMSEVDEEEIMTDWKKWLNDWFNKAELNDVLIVTGSHYFAGICRHYLMDEIVNSD
ncbi:bifunctional folylpolyglutamate synthase/dihydrofolate synthase [Salipaludibacillus sp. LMS25]|uniref:bifunctional folylpolyglutamate synthase/dihydrofolate synthase n=1 Tax=Salipaludibacillus sp. LMS25 TaxID=2924031 RepID=UPI0020D02245|nr:folylpolyglutamate synthase/dihydrofolate synthase family protein [Salipaludibacillus sp. LMS25]UTR15473.1 bifunctional folylpolyglutamate synthase/dihydrofolate synthase [Salipaludibacillus sp. LMS25]